jgi:hypothetical protein
LPPKCLSIEMKSLAAFVVLALCFWDVACQGEDKDVHPIEKVMKLLSTMAKKKQWNDKKQKPSSTQNMNIGVQTRRKH